MSKSYLCLPIAVFFLFSLTSELTFSTEPKMEHPFSFGSTVSNAKNMNLILPDTLNFQEYRIQDFGDGTPPFYPEYTPNILPSLPTCLHSVTKIDQYGNLKIYAGCTNTEIYNWRSYPPLHTGDVFPVLDHLYYFEQADGSIAKPHKAIKVLSVSGSPSSISSIRLANKIILPLVPLDILPDANGLSHRCQIICRISSLLRMGGASLVQIKETSPQNFSAVIYMNSNKDGYTGIEELGRYIDSFQTKKEYKVGDIVISRYRAPDQRYDDESLPLASGFRITRIVPSGQHVFKTAEGEKKGRLIGWVELDPTPIPIDENGNPIEDKE